MYYEPVQAYIIVSNLMEESISIKKVKVNPYHAEYFYVNVKT